MRPHCWFEEGWNQGAGEWEESSRVLPPCSLCRSHVSNSSTGVSVQPTSRPGPSLREGFETRGAQDRDESRGRASSVEPGGGRGRTEGRGSGPWTARGCEEGQGDQSGEWAGRKGSKVSGGPRPGGRVRRARNNTDGWGLSLETPGPDRVLDCGPPTSHSYELPTVDLKTNTH